MHPWHDIESGTSDAMNVIIEISKGSRNKYEVDKKTGLIALDRVTHTTQDFPFDYGFIPKTLWDDGDPLDVVLLTSWPIDINVLVKVRPVALMHMIDDGEGDEKVIAVPADDPRWNDVQDLKDINKHMLKEIEHFYTTYKMLQKKIVSVKGFEGKKAAQDAFLKAQRKYQKKFKKKK